jgi:hypothetical protein
MQFIGEEDGYRERHSQETLAWKKAFPTCVNVPESPPPLGPRATQRIVSPALASGGRILTPEQKFETLSGETVPVPSYR